MNLEGIHETIVNRYHYALDLFDECECFSCRVEWEDEVEKGGKYSGFVLKVFRDDVLCDVEEPFLSVRVIGDNDGVVHVYKKAKGVYDVALSVFKTDLYVVEVSVVDYVIGRFERKIRANFEEGGVVEREKPLWVEDDSVSRCASCTQEFTFFVRRHHCRNCGNIFCADCTGLDIMIPDLGIYKPARVCVDCYYYCKKNLSKTKFSVKN
eukprot:TRINITY_DN11847_c0_g1_i1.p1 TRINITY_DN11847_c0_g1~~TRINITY_DN11847_c0_g1_i1.p1  ORF type:complete len:240 (+),score=48.47 TRINITY_DN11847_c0_g1_i1:95-721(+)